MDVKISNQNHQSVSLPEKIYSWIESHDYVILLSFLFIFGCIWLTAELAEEVVEGNTHEIDTAVLISLREGENADNPIGPPWVEEMMRDFTALGGTGILTLIVLGVSFYYLIQGRYKEILVLLIAVGGAYLLSAYFKDFFARPRPEFIPDGDYKYTASFPSGHALLAAATYLTLGSIIAQPMPGTRLKVFVVMSTIFVTVLVGFTRVYLGVHWPTDVLAGWTLGSGWALICWLVVRWLRQKGLLPPHMLLHHHP